MSALAIVTILVVVLAIVFAAGSMVLAYAALRVDLAGRDDSRAWILCFTFAGIALLLISGSAELATRL